MKGRVFLFAGGGTGGHIFPALAIAQAIEARADDASFLFACSDRAVDAAILKAADRRFVALPATALGMSPRALIRLAWRWGRCVRRARQLIAEEKKRGHSVHVIAMGGFAAPAVVQAARAEGAPVTLVNLDATPGRANRWIARRAQRVFTTYPIPRRPGWTPIPPIVRASARAPGDARSCRELLGLDTDRPTLVVAGGSQGAATINAAMIELASTSPTLFSAWQVFHLSGDRDADEVRQAYEGASIRARVAPFWAEMGQVWGAADLAIARAGAGAVSELQANAVPTIFLPYPYHRDEHQRRNAEPISQAGGCVILTDTGRASENADQLRSALSELLSDSARRSAMRQALGSLGPTDGADRLAERLIEG